MLKIKLTLNNLTIEDYVQPDEMLVDFVRRHGAKSVKRGCDTSNCGACSVLVDGKPVLACSTPAYRCQGKHVETLENLLNDTEALRSALASRGADQCGFCNPGMIISTVALMRELEQNPTQLPTLTDVNSYLMGNLCRCTGYISQTESILAVLKERHAQLAKQEVVHE